jgi:PAS domain S-box-containing protein
MIQQRTLPPEPASASAARRFANTVLQEWRETDVADVVALLVSELVTNAVLHAGSPVKIAVRRRGGYVRIEVADESPVAPGIRDYEDDATTGRGLGMIEMLAESWGVDAGVDGGKIVWFEVPAAHPEIVLEAVADKPPHVLVPDDEVVIRLVGAPVRLFPAVQQHVDAMLREYALVALQLQPTGAAPPHLLVDMRAVPAQIRAAIQVGSPTVDLVVSSPAAVRDSVIEARDALEVADHLAAEAKLLNPPALAEVRACREWFLGEVIAQLDGREPTAWSATDVRTERRTPVQVDHRLALDNLTAAVVVADDQNHIAYINAAAEALLGWEAADLEGQRLTAIIPQRLHEAHIAGYTRYLVTRQPRLLGNPVRVPAMRRDGAEIDIELVLNSFAARDGRQMFVALLHEQIEEASDPDVAEHWLGVIPHLVASSSLTRGQLLELLGTRLGWEFAAWWTPHDERLRCEATWCAEPLAFEAFENVTRTRVFRPNEGLPGRVWATGSPEWLNDVVRDANFPRVSLALEHGLRTACAFPVIADDVTAGVIELFSARLRPADEGLTDVLETLGRVAGLVVRD